MKRCERLNRSGTIWPLLVRIFRNERANNSKSVSDRLRTSRRSISFVSASTVALRSRGLKFEELCGHVSGKSELVVTQILHATMIDVDLLGSHRGAHRDHGSLIARRIFSEHNVEPDFKPALAAAWRARGRMVVHGV